MSIEESYYADKNFINTTYACDIAVENHLANMLFNDDLTRIIYASNAYAFRERSDDNTGVLEMPFLNYKLSNYEHGPRIWWNIASYTQGVYISELEAKIQYSPVTLHYECSVWCNRDDELNYIASEINFDADNKTSITPVVSIESNDLNLNALLSYTNNTYDPEYNEVDFLTKNKIHSMSINFTLDTFSLKYNNDITIPTTAVLEFYSSHTGYEGKSFDETYTYLVNHLTEEVTGPIDS